MTKGPGNVNCNGCGELLSFAFVLKHECKPANPETLMAIEKIGRISQKAYISTLTDEVLIKLCSTVTGYLFGPSRSVTSMLFDEVLIRFRKIKET